jgi:AraC family ethanolamine operon transcriptional activator
MDSEPTLAAAVPGGRDEPRGAGSAELDDVEQLAQLRPGWRLDVLQLSPGRYRGQLRWAWAARAGLFEEVGNCSVRQRGERDAGLVAFAMLCGPTAGARFHGHPVPPESLLIGRGDTLDLCLPAGASLLSLLVPAQGLRALWPGLYGKPWSRWLDGQVVVPARPGMAAALAHRHRQALDAMTLPATALSAQAAAGLADAVLLEWLQAIPPTVRADEPAALCAQRRLVEKACTEVLDAADETPSLQEVCRRVGASPRRLQHCFQALLGVSPLHYLRAARLGAVRRELRRAAGSGGTVQEIAHGHGFWHMGAFSAEYKRLFGELPTATLGPRLSGARRARRSCSG